MLPFHKKGMMVSAVRAISAMTKSATDRDWACKCLTRDSFNTRSHLTSRIFPYSQTGTCIPRLLVLA